MTWKTVNVKTSHFFVDDGVTLCGRKYEIYDLKKCKKFTKECGNCNTVLKTYSNLENILLRKPMEVRIHD